MTIKVKVNGTRNEERGRLTEIESKGFISEAGIPVVESKLAKSKKYNAVICLGAVIRGATPHFDYIANEIAKGAARVSLDTGVPCIFGVITADNLEQAIERAGTKQGNRGRDAAINAIEMANLFTSL